MARAPHFVNEKLNGSVQRIGASVRSWYINMMSTVLANDVADTPSVKARQILDAAKRLFMEQGFGDVSMDAIARDAGVSKATLYAHFASKQVLLAAIVRAECRRHAEALIAPDIAHEDVRTALRYFGRAFLTLLFSPGALAMYRIIFAESQRFPELGRIFYESGPRLTLTNATAYLRQATERGELNASDPSLAAEHLIAMLKGVRDHRCLLGVAEPLTQEEIERRVDSTIDVFLRAYAPAH